MAILHYENWDGVSAPAIPSGWSVTSGLVTLASGSSPTPVSTPNVIEAQSGSAAFYVATWGTADSNSGNVSVQGTGIIGLAGSVVDGQFSVLARGSSSSLLYASSTYYEAQIDRDNQTLYLNSVVSGTSTTLASLGSSSLVSDVWYQITLT